MIKVDHPNGYKGILYGQSGMTIYSPDGEIFLHTDKRAINTKSELQDVLSEVSK